MAVSASVRAFLEEKRFAVLATIGTDSLPHQTVMWYEFRDDAIIMNTAVGRIKERHLRHDPRASICIADGYRFVTISGNVEFIEDGDAAQAEIRRLTIRYNGPDNVDEQVKQYAKQQRVTVRVPVQHLIAYGFDQE